MVIDKKNIRQYWNKYFPFIITIGFLAFGITLMYFHEFWFDEIYAWSLSRKSVDFIKFLDNMKGLGHPYLWYGTVYFISHYITDNIEAMKVIHLAVSTITAFLFLKYSPFNKIIKVMCVFGYFMFYEYSIISRNYAFGVLFIIIFCILYKNKYKNIIPIGIVLLLMGQTNIFAFSISISLFLMFLIDILMDWKKIRENVKKIHLILLISVVIIEVVLFYLQVRFDNYSIYSAFNKSTEEYLTSIFRISKGLMIGYVPIFNFNLNYLGTNLIFNFLSNQGLFYSYLFSVVLFIFPLLIIKRKAFFLYIFGSLAIISVPLFLAVCTTRHFGHFFILLIVCLWISDTSKDSQFLIKSKENIIKKIQFIYLIIILTVSLIGTSIACYYEYRYPFSSGKEVAQYIEDKFDKNNLVIVGYQDYASVAVSEYLKKEIYWPQTGHYSDYSRWGKDRQGALQLESVFAEAYALTRNNDIVLVLISGEPVKEPDIYKKYYFIELDKKFDNSIFAKENFYLYLFNKDTFIDKNKSKLMYRIDTSNFEEYWCSLNNCEFVKEHDSTLIKVYGRDPGFENNFPLQFDNDNDISIIVDIYSVEDGIFQIYFLRENIGHYTEENSIISPMHKGKNNLYMKIPNVGDIKSIRVDPINIESDCYIKYIEIYN